MNNPELTSNDTSNNETWQMDPEQPVDIDNSQMNDEPPAEAASVKEKEYEYTLPDGNRFVGTPEEFKQAMEDYRDRIGA